MPGGYSCKFLVGVCRPVLKILTRFSDLALRQKLCHWSTNKQIIQTHFEFVYIVQFPRKPHSIPDQNGQSVYQFSDQNGAKTLPDGVAHTYIAYLRDYPPPHARPGLVSKRLCVETTGSRKVTCLHRECYSMHAGKVIWKVMIWELIKWPPMFLLTHSSIKISFIF